MEKMKETTEINNKINYIITFFLASISFVIQDIFFMIYYNGTGVWINVFTIIISIIGFMLLWTIFKKSNIAIVTEYCITLIITIVNTLKMDITHEPIYLSDIRFLSKATSFVTLLKEYLTIKIFSKYFLIFWIFILLLIILGFIAKKNMVKISKIKKRIIIFIIMIFIILFLFLPNSNTKNLLLNIFFKNDEYLDYEGYGTNEQYYLKYGLTKGIYGNYLNKLFLGKNEYDEQYYRNLEEEIAENKNENNLGKPNIIVISSESFWDLEQLDEVKFDKKVTENFNNLKKEGFLVNMLSPSYGGMSENPMWELLTGGTMNYFPNGYIPITFLYDDEDRISKSNSLVKRLKEEGYKTKITFFEDFYQSEKAYKKLGFDEYVELISDSNNFKYEFDENLTELIINDLEEDNKNIFCVYSTFEGHMPYNEEKYEDYDINIESSNLYYKENEVIRTYAQGIYNADKQLKKLYDYIKQKEENTILIFFGDHLPYLYDEEKNLINKLEYFNTEDEKINLYRKYNTQALILANYDISELNLPEYLGYNQLLTHITNKLDLSEEKHYKILEKTAKNLPTSNKYISLDAQGNIYYTKDLNEEMKKNYDIQRYLVYKYFIEK